jgi:ribose-phosphate pyrophosphokinase
LIYFENTPINFETFPNGEIRIANPDAMYAGHHSVTLKYESGADLIKLMFVKRYLDSVNNIDGTGASKTTILRIAYMPYSRQDRVQNGSAFTLKYVCDFINSLGFNKAIVLEPHSDVTCALLDRVVAVELTAAVVDLAMKGIGFDEEKDYVFFPDAGAQKRYSGKIIAKNQLVAFKKRNFDTGRIESLDILGYKFDNPNPGKILIVDDLCSYGGTFLMSANRLANEQAVLPDIYLAVAHCENSVLAGDMIKSSFIKKIFTTNTILSPEIKHEKICIYDVIGVSPFDENCISTNAAM